ncbi:MAG: hypothetical protein ACRDHJ_03340, partial [Actinomycetota bacterium]
AGIRTVFCAGDPDPPQGVRVVRVRRLGEALTWAKPRRRPGRRDAPNVDASDTATTEPAA